jgi:hypothetical protein
MFQKLYLPREGRLGHVHARCGAAEMQVLCGCKKAAKLSEFKMSPE